LPNDMKHCFVGDGLNSLRFASTIQNTRKCFKQQGRVPQRK